MLSACSSLFVVFLFCAEGCCRGEAEYVLSLLSCVGYPTFESSCIGYATFESSCVVGVDSFQ